MEDEIKVNYFIYFAIQLKFYAIYETFVFLSGATIQCEGPCPCCKCPKVFSPVCGNDDKSYPNECEANCK